MDLKNFIITNGKAAGLTDDQINGVIASAVRKLPGNVPQEKWEQQIMIWINDRAQKNKEGNAKGQNEEKENSEH